MTAMVETNPDYSRQMYEPQYNSHRPPDPPVVTSGLVSESDIRHQERQERLKYELSKEYHDHMQKSDTGGFKEEAARQRREEIMRRQSPTRQPPQSDMYDHNQMSQHLREERRREYNDFLDPRSQHNGDYNDMNDQQHQEQILNRAQNQVDMPVLDRRNQSPVRDAYNSPSVPPLGLDRRPPSGRWDPESYRQTNYAPVKRLSSPPHQANIGADDYSEYRRKVERDSRNSEYNQFLARKQVEDDARKQKMNEVRRQPAAPVVKGDYYDSESYDLKRQYLMEEKHKEYQNYLKKKGEPFARYDMRNRSDNESPRAKGVELSVRSDLQDQDSEGDKSPHRSRSNAYYGSTIGALLTGKELNYPNSARQRFLEEKKHAYNEQVKKQGDLQPRKPYNPNGPENRIGFMANLGTSLDRQRESLAHQRHEEYNNFLKDKYYRDHQDSWYKPSIQRNDDRTSKPRDERPDDRPGSQRRSGTNQSYEDMLQAKRRQEANYRREDYHDYSRPGDRY